MSFYCGHGTYVIYSHFSFNWSIVEDKEIVTGNVFSEPYFKFIVIELSAILKIFLNIEN